MSNLQMRKLRLKDVKYHGQVTQVGCGRMRMGSWIVWSQSVCLSLSYTFTTSLTIVSVKPCLWIRFKSLGPKCLVLILYQPQRHWAWSFPLGKTFSRTLVLWNPNVKPAMLSLQPLDTLDSCTLVIWWLHCLALLLTTCLYQLST